MVAPSAISAAPGLESRMRAAVITRPRQVGVVTAEVPHPGPHEVRVRLEGCGLCGSNLPVWEGRPWFEYPREAGTPGHEGWGVVDALGEQVHGLTLGARVALLSEHAFAEFDIAGANAVVRLPATLGSAPFPGEPLGCAVNVFRRSGVHAGQTVAIVGLGFLGALLAQLTLHEDARVIAITRRPFALELARQYGIRDAIEWRDSEEVRDQVRTLTSGRGCDCVIECVGVQSSLDLASELVCVRGRLVVAGYHQDGLRQVNMQSWNWRGIDVVNAHERDPLIYRAGIEAATAAMAAGVLDPSRLYTHTFPLEQLQSGFELMAGRPDGFMKALVMM